MKTNFLNENKIFDWLKTKSLNKYQSYWKKENKTEQKSKVLNELTTVEPKISYQINIPLFHKHSVAGYKTEIFELIKVVVE